MRMKPTPTIDPGLQAIADLERDIVLAKEQTWTWNGVDPAEIARELPAVAAVAKAVCDRLRAEYRSRQS